MLVSLVATPPLPRQNIPGIRAITFAPTTESQVPVQLIAQCACSAGLPVIGLGGPSSARVVTGATWYMHCANAANGDATMRIEANNDVRMPASVAFCALQSAARSRPWR